MPVLYLTYAILYSQILMLHQQFSTCGLWTTPSAWWSTNNS